MSTSAAETVSRSGPGPYHSGLNLRRLRVVATVAPAAFTAALLAGTALFADDIPLPLLISVGVLAVTAAAMLFSGIVFDVVERSEASLVESNEQLAALRIAAMSIAEEYELSQLLQRFVDVSRQLTGARYGALSVLGADGFIEQFITSGMSDEERHRIGPLPLGRGLLGAIIHEGIRLDDMSKDPRSIGFPPHHPPMRSLLGVPVQSRTGTLGNLYLTDKVDAPGFSDADEQMVRTFAAHAALAIETSRLQGEARSLAVLRERERIGMDLHDGIIQSIYAVELGLEGAEEDLDSQDVPAAREALGLAIDQLNAVIRDVRSYIFELRPAKLSYDLSEGMMKIVDEFRASASAQLVADVAPALPHLREEQRLALFHIARDALVNAHRHARASRIDVSLHANVSVVRLVVGDDGVGFDVSAARPEHHRGLQNMASRAEAAGGVMTIESTPGTGTTVLVEFPVRAEEGAPT